MMQLYAGKTASLMYGLSKTGKSPDELVVSYAHTGEIAAPRIMYAGGFQDVQPDTASGSGFMVTYEFFTDFTATTCKVRNHGRHDNAVTKRLAPYGERCENIN